MKYLLLLIILTGSGCERRDCWRLHHQHLSINSSFLSDYSQIDFDSPEAALAFAKAHNLKVCDFP